MWKEVDVTCLRYYTNMSLKVQTDSSETSGQSVSLSHISTGEWPPLVRTSLLACRLLGFLWLWRLKALVQENSHHNDDDDHHHIALLLFSTSSVPKPRNKRTAKVDVSVCLIKRHVIKGYVEMGVYLHAFLTSTLGGDE